MAKGWTYNGLKRAPHKSRKRAGGAGRRQANCALGRASIGPRASSCADGTTADPATAPSPAMAAMKALGDGVSIGTASFALGSMTVVPPLPSLEATNVED